MVIDVGSALDADDWADIDGRDARNPHKRSDVSTFVSTGPFDLPPRGVQDCVYLVDLVDLDQT